MRRGSAETLPEGVAIPLFFHDICMFGDEAGWAQLLQEHKFEHVQFVQLGQPSGILIPDYDLGSWENATEFARNWLTTHETVHELLRNATGVSGINLADVNLAEEGEFYQWLDAHRLEHVALRSAFGITT